MAKKKTDALKRRGLPVWASISLIVVLGLAALVLVYAALQQVNRGSENQGFSTVESVQDEATLLSVPSGDGVPETPSSEVVIAEETVAEAAPSNERLELVAPTRLIALDQNLAVRASVGECGAGTSDNLEFSHDGGNTWNPSPSFAETSATQVLRLLPSADGRTFVVALNAECSPQIYSTTDNGQTWVVPVSAVGTWYLDPASPRQLGAPGGVKTINCDAMFLSPVTDSNVGVLCADGAVITTTNGGMTWSDPVPTDGGLVLVYSKEQLLLGSQGGEDCEGISVSGIDGGGASCIDLNPSEIGSGELALAQSGSNILAWAGESITTSQDGGQTWQ